MWALYYLFIFEIIMQTYNTTDYLFYAKHWTRHWEYRGEKENTSVSTKHIVFFFPPQWEKKKKQNKCDGIREKGLLTVPLKSRKQIFTEEEMLEFVVKDISEFSMSIKIETSV